MISNIINFAHELSHEFPKDLTLRELENIRKILKLGGDSLLSRTKKLAAVKKYTTANINFL